MDSFNWAGFSFPRRIVGLPRGSKADRLQAAQELSDAVQDAQEQIRRLWSARHNGAVRELIRACIVTVRDSREQLTNEYSDIEV